MVRTAALLLLPVALTACGDLDAVGPNKGYDRGMIGRKHLSQLKAGIWVDPTGCDHWIIDDGLEGYMSLRLDKHGKPVCSGVAPPNTATGPFKKGGDIPDPTRSSEKVTWTQS
ncbi:hypothetical protein FGG78_34685 [Thioclava sp. BHET1]|nr:hypothetical protein FGG78_34685 [Thioclava sp. BHET1]